MILSLKLICRGLYGIEKSPVIRNIALRRIPKRDL